jgi:hypothetical protein
MNCGLNTRGIRVSSLARETDFPLFPQCPDRMWGPIYILANAVCCEEYALVFNESRNPWSEH